MKRLLLLLLFLSTGCAPYDTYDDSHTYDENNCPDIEIARDNAYLTQFVNYQDKFQISINGYEGFCYYETIQSKHRAVIRPIFKIKRLAPSEETDVRFSFYTETRKGPPQYIGKKTYHATAHIKRGETETLYQAPAVKVFIPSTAIDGYDINLGLVVSPEEKRYNSRTFDVEYPYKED